MRANRTSTKADKLIAGTHVIWKFRILNFTLENKNITRNLEMIPKSLKYGRDD